MRSLQRALAVLVVVGTCALGLGAVSYDDSPEAWATLLDLLAAERVLQIHAETGAEAVIPSKWIRLDEYARGLPEMFKRRLPSRDGWDAAFMIGELEGRLALLSKGRNGFADLIEASAAGRSVANRQSATTAEPAFGDDMVLVVGQGDEVTNAPLTLRARQKRTMADLRSIGTAVETLSIDNDFYPAQDGRLQGLESIRGQLEPTYIRTLPLVDAWGRPFLYWSNRDSYVIVSAGADGVLDEAWKDTPPLGVDLVGPNDKAGAEIVFVNGQFGQWPPLGH